MVPGDWWLVFFYYICFDLKSFGKQIKCYNGSFFCNEWRHFLLHVDRSSSIWSEIRGRSLESQQRRMATVSGCWKSINQEGVSFSMLGPMWMRGWGEWKWGYGCGTIEGRANRIWVYAWEGHPQLVSWNEMPRLAGLEFEAIYRRL